MSDYFACSRVDLDFLNQTKNIFRTETVVKATPAQVFEVFEDAQAWVAWVKPLEKLEWTSPRPYGVGTSRMVTMLGGIDGYEEFVAWQADKRMAFTFTGCSNNLVEKLMEDYQVSDLGSGRSRVEWAMGFELRGFPRYLIWLARPILRITQRRMFARFKEYVENYAIKQATDAHSVTM